MNEDFPAKPPKWRLRCSECGLPMAIWDSREGLAQCQCPNKHCPQRSTVFEVRNAEYDLPSQIQPACA